MASGQWVVCLCQRALTTLAPDQRTERYQMTPSGALTLVPLPPWGDFVELCRLRSTYTDLLLAKAELNRVQGILPPIIRRKLRILGHASVRGNQFLLDYSHITSIQSSKHDTMI